MVGYTILIDQKINLQTFKEKALKKNIVVERLFTFAKHPFLKNIIIFHFQMQRNLEKKL